MPTLTDKTDGQIDQWIRNHEDKGVTSSPLFVDLFEERARRSHGKSHFEIDKSLELLKQAAVEQRYVTYGDLANASKVEWSKARHKLNGANGHLDRLLDVCHVRKLPMLPAICVNESGRESGELEAVALRGFVTGTRRLGHTITDEREFHRKARDECWRWGRDQP